MMIISFLRRLWAALTTPQAPSRYDAPAFREWLAAQRQPFTLADAAEAAGFSPSELTRDNCSRTAIALRRLGFLRLERRDGGTRYWYCAPPGLALQMPRRQSGFYNFDLMPFFLALVVLGVLLGAVLTEGLPWAWSLIKPWLHEVTR